MRWFSLQGFKFLLVVAFTIASAMSANEILNFDNDELRDRYSDLTFQFRCPKCQNQNVADSNAPISEDIREKTYQMLHQGYSNQEIIDFMVERYTEFVIYKPQFSFITMWLWIVPGFLLLCGAWFLISLTSKTKIDVVEDISDAQREQIKQLMKGES